MTLTRSVLSVAGFSFATFAASAAIAAPAEPAPGQPAATNPSPDADTPIELIPPAKDTLSGHFQLGASGLLAVPFARLDSKTTFGGQAAGGYGFAADLGIGVSRSVVLGGYGQYLKLGEGDDCRACDPSSLGFGAFVRYHLVQGVRFDPWASLGVGYRMLDTGEADYSGIDWLRFSVGGDWYALSQVGFGPYLELNLGTFTDRPSGTDAAIYATFAAGLRIAIDVQGK